MEFKESMKLFCRILTFNKVILVKDLKVNMLNPK